MADLPAVFMPHHVAVEPFLGDQADNDAYGQAWSGIPCLQAERSELLPDGQVVTIVTLYLPLGKAYLFPPQSRVTLAGGGVAYVQSRARHTDGGMGGWQCAEVVCR